MRGHLLPLFQHLKQLRGVGPKHGEALERLLGATRILDLLLLTPRKYLFYPLTDIVAATKGQRVTLKGQVVEHTPPPRRGLPYIVRLEDNSGGLRIAYFHSQTAWLRQTYSVGRTLRLRCTISEYHGELQTTHPDVLRGDVESDISEWVAHYDLVHGLLQIQVRQWVGQCLDLLDKLAGPEEWHDPSELGSWPGWKECLHRLHQPRNADDADITQVHARRLAYDELLSYVMALGIVRRSRRQQASWATSGDSRLQKRFHDSLPFSFTNAQEQAIATINSDLQTGKRMARLLMGDVGSGKTVVGFSAVVLSCEEGYQSALMAPTELLARQHFETARQLLSDIMPVRLLTGSTKRREKTALLEELAAGSPLLLIGTQALISDLVQFTHLGLIVIDEQHRFGVEQRMLLGKRGHNPHLLLLSATPIPRTMQMVLYRDLDVTMLREKPPGRKPIDTRALPMRRRKAVIERLRYALQRGQKIYWVCPLVEDDEAADTSDDKPAVVARYSELSTSLENYGALFAIHGKMKSKQQTEVMESFRNSAGAILVASTVIEVGVDVRDADIIVIDTAERFGLAQLHQLRGRVGRNDRQAHCLLLHSDGISGIAGQRLKALCEHDDGFTLADIDLKLRGGGEIAGMRQSGFLAMRIFDPYRYPDLLERANDDADRLIDHDPDLQTPRGARLRQLMTLYGHDSIFES